jgi:hypothetical protein
MPRHRWKDNSNMDLKTIGYEVADWIHMAQDRDQWWALVNTIINLQLASSEAFCSMELVVYGCESWPLTLRDEHKITKSSQATSRIKWLNGKKTNV